MKVEIQKIGIGGMVPMIGEEKATCGWTNAKQKGHKIHIHKGKAQREKEKILLVAIWDEILIYSIPLYYKYSRCL